MTLAQTVYGVPANVILDSAARAVSTWDVVTSMIKAWVFGVIISVVGCMRTLYDDLHDIHTQFWRRGQQSWCEEPTRRVMKDAVCLVQITTCMSPFRRLTPCHLPCMSQVSCAWGFTTTGGAKGVGESTTSAVVISLVLIFIADFFLSFLFFQGQGDALRTCM